MLYLLPRKLVTSRHKNDIYDRIRLAYKLGFIFIICRNA